MNDLPEAPSPFNFESLSTTTSLPYPLGATCLDDGVSFAVVSRHAHRMSLALFAGAHDNAPAREFDLERTGDVWHIRIVGLTRGAYYAYRAEGPSDRATGHRFDPDRFLLDPYARAIEGDVQAGRGKSVVIAQPAPWAEDAFPRIPMNKTIIYEAHVRGMTQHPSSGVAHPGTYRGLIEKIPHLKDLGITTIELLPIQEAGESSLGRCSLITHEELHNYWGYNTIGFFAPASRYATNGAAGAHLDEFRELVAALHREGIELFLDVVYNHTAEGNDSGPTLCFRGLDNSIYYMLDADGAYLDFSGCGNTFNCNHPVVQNMIMDSLRYWVSVMHIDGFRFDLATILSRRTDGALDPRAPLIERIAQDPILRDTKIIAEAWDAAGGYQVGSFGGSRWAEWNGKYRDDVRRYWHGDADAKGVFATRVTGSSDLYAHNRTPLHSVNFVSAHDGFTLRDLYTYEKKRNEANGESNRDGSDWNCGWNCGVEGETNDPAIRALRQRMQCNLAATLFLSLGVPMMLAGDEFGRTQLGNNNAYCQDNETSWIDWSLKEKNADLYHFFKAVIAFRHANPAFKRATYFNGDATSGVQWFDAAGNPQNWHTGDPALAYLISPGANAGHALYFMMNPTAAWARFRVPPGQWSLRIDTGEAPPNSIVGESRARRINGGSKLRVAPHSLCVLREAHDL